MVESLLPLTAILLAPLLAGSIVRSGLASLPLQWLFGLLTFALLVQLAHGLGVPQAMAKAGVALLCATGALVRVKQGGMRAPRLVPSDYLLIALALLLVVHGASEVIRTPVIAWDAVAIWFNKARSITCWAPLSRVPVPDYPNAGPALWALPMQFLCLPEHAGRLVFPMIYVAGSLVMAQMRCKSDSGKTLYLVLWASWTFYLFTEWTWNGYQDNFIAVVSSVSVFMLVPFLANQALIKKHDYSMPIAFYMLGSLFFIKNEGLFLGMIIIFVFLFSFIIFKINTNHIEHNIFIFLGMMILFSFPIALRIGFHILNNIESSSIQGHAFNMHGLLQIHERLWRVPFIIRSLYSYAGQVLPAFIAVILIPLTSLKLHWNSENRKINFFLFAILALHILFVFFTFLATNADFQWHLDTAFNRLMSQNLLIMVLTIHYNMALIIDSDDFGFFREK